MTPSARVFGLLVGLLAGAEGLLAQAPMPATPLAPVAAVAAAHAAIDAMAAGRFADVVARFTPAMRAAFSEDRLRTTWSSVTASAGALRRQNTERIAPKDALQVVVIPCEFEKAMLDVQIVVDPAGSIASLTIRPSTTSNYALPSYATAGAYSEREVTVGAGAWALPGTLTVPAGTGPFPAVVLVHGSGPNDRDESIGGHKPFKDLALGLASRGVVVLRYEKRTRQHAAAMMSLASMTVNDETIDDAVLAVDLLRTVPEVDARRVVVLGHSLGGMLVPRIAAATPRAAGFIVMAGAARPLEDAMVEQTRYLASLDGTVTPAEEAAIAQAARLQTDVRALTGPQGPAIGGAPASYWWDLRGYDPPAAAKAVTRPMLVLQGERDYQVTPAEYARWQAALSGRASVTFLLYPGLNHLFDTGTGPGRPAEYMAAGHVAEDVIRDLAAWVAALSPQTS